MAPYSRKRKYGGGYSSSVKRLDTAFDVEVVFVGVVGLDVVCFVVSVESDVRSPVVES